MTDQASLKNETKKELRSLLLSSKNEMHLADLEKDYHNIVGNPIPFRQMGYSTLADFIHDIPDVVSHRLVFGKLKVSGVPDENTIHIANLVARQKSNKKGPPRNGRGNNRYFAATSVNRRWTPTENSYRQSSGANRYESHTSSKPAAAGSDKHNSQLSMFNIFRGQVKELLYTYPTGIRLSKFEEAFESKFRCRLQLHQLGHSTVRELIEAIPDIALLENIKDSSDVMIIGRCSKLLCRVSPGDQKVGEDADSFTSSSGSLEQWKANIQQVLAAHGQGLKASRFLSEYKRLLNTELDLKSAGFITVVDLMASIPDIVVMERPSAGDWVLFDARTHQQAPESKDCESEALQKNFQLILDIVRRCPFGLLMNKLPAEFEARAGHQLNYVQMGFSSFEDVVCHLKDKISMEYKGEGQVLLRIKPQNVVQKTSSPAKPLSSLNHSSIPEDAILTERDYPAISYPQVSDSYIPVRVSNVASPGKFWLQLDASHNDLETLMDNIQEYRSYALDCYKVPAEMLQIGLICAGVFADVESEWHRCKITGFNDHFVELYYIDYGNTGCVSRSAIRFLRSKFYSLPAQAIDARLTNTHPVDKSWSKSSFQSFYSMIVFRVVLARVTHVSSEGLLSVCLCDVSGPEDIHIQDELNRLGHAIFRQDIHSQNDDQELSASQYIPQLPPSAEEEDYQTYNGNKTSSDKSTELVKSIRLTAHHSVDLISINDCYYIHSTDVSALLWDDDVIIPCLATKQKMRQYSHIKIKTLELSDDEELVMALARASVRGIVCNGILKPVITLYELRSVLDILDMFRCESKELTSAVELLIQECYNSADVSFTAEARANEAHKKALMKEQMMELETTFKGLESHRKVVLQKMNRAQTAERSRQIVDELTDIECEQQRIELLMKEVRHKLAQDEATPNGLIDSPAKQSPELPSAVPRRISNENAYIPHAAVNQASAKIHLQQQFPSNLTNSLTPAADLSAMMSQLTLAQVAASANASLGVGLGPLGNGLSSAIPAAAAGVGLNIVPGWGDFLQIVSRTDSDTLVQAYSSGSLLGPDTLHMLATRSGGSRPGQSYY